MRERDGARETEREGGSERKGERDAQAHCSQVSEDIKCRPQSSSALANFGTFIIVPNLSLLLKHIKHINHHY